MEINLLDLFASLRPRFALALETRTFRSHIRGAQRRIRLSEPGAHACGSLDDRTKISAHISSIAVVETSRRHRDVELLLKRHQKMSRFLRERALPVRARMSSVWQRLRGRRGKVRFSAFGLLAALGTAPDVTARELTWKAPAACQQSAYVAEQIETMTGRSLVSIEDYDFSVEVAEGPGPTWELLLVTKPRGAAEQSERRFRGTSCSEVSDAAAVAIALTLRGDAAELLPAEPREPEPMPSQSVTVPPASERRRRDVPTRRAGSRERNGVSSVAAHLGLGGVFEAGALPGAGFGGSLSAGVGLQPLRFELRGGLLGPRGAETSGGRGGDFQLAFGAALACYERELGGPRGLGCLGYEIGSLSGEGYGVADPRLGSTLWHGILVELGAGLPLSEALSLSVRAGGTLPLSRRAFVLDRGEQVHRPSTISGRAQAGFEISL
jgi:hypothetical protein